MEKHFQLSCPVFWGFNRYMDIDTMKSKKEILEAFLKVHEEFLFINNYVDMLNFFKKHEREYHIHDLDYEKILQSDQTIYICRHGGVCNLSEDHVCLHNDKNENENNLDIIIRN